MPVKQYYVYILANPRDTVLYTGVTSDLVRRVWEHKQKMADGFTKRYNVNKLVYYEVFSTAFDAIAREKQIKSGPRNRKIALIHRDNPSYRDLYETIV